MATYMDSKNRTICLLCLYLWSIYMVDGKSFGERSKRSFNGPCAVLEDSGSSVSTPLIDTTRNLILLTEDLQEYVTETKSLIGERLRSSIIVDLLEGESFTDTEAVLINDENRQECIANSTTAMIKQYRQLYELVLHVEHIRTNGHLSTLNSEHDMRVKLSSIQSSIYSIICTVQIGLLSEWVDTTNTVTTSVLSPEFISYDWNYTYEIFRSYVVMKDSERLLGYLNEMYKAIENSYIS